MEMTNTARELKKSMGDTLELCKRKLSEEVFDDDGVDTELIELMRSMFRMCDLAMKLTCEQAEAIEKIDNKLDKLLASK